jgi:hypothetical protein
MVGTKSVKGTDLGASGCEEKPYDAAIRQTQYPMFGYHSGAQAIATLTTS